MTLGYEWMRKFNKRIDEADFWLFELSVWLHVLARSLVGVFIPVFLYNAGFSIKEIIIFYTLFHAIDVPLNFLVPILIKKYGARVVFAMSTIMVIGFFVVLSVIESGDWMMAGLLVLLVALYDVLYWNSHLFLFIQSNQQDSKTDRNTGVLFSVKRVAAMIGPFIGASFLVYSNGDLLLLLSVVIFLISLIPLIKVDDFSDRPRGDMWSLKKFFSHREEKKNYISAMLYGIHGAVEFIIWPLFIYVTLSSIESVALVPIVISVTTIVFTFFLGSNSARFRGGMITVGAFVLAFVWILRLFVPINEVIYASMFLASFFMLLVSIPLNASIFDRAMKTHPLSAMIYRNAFVMLGRFFMFLLLLVLVSIFEISFIFASLALILLAGFNGFILMVMNHEFDELLHLKHHHNLEEH